MYRLIDDLRPNGNGFAPRATRRLRASLSPPPPGDSRIRSGEALFLDMREHQEGMVIRGELQARTAMRQAVP
jgi:hypothetical protein